MQVHGMASHAIDGTLLALLENLTRSLLQHLCFKEDLLHQAYIWEGRWEGEWEVGDGRGGGDGR